MSGTTPLRSGFILVTPFAWSSTGSSSRSCLSAKEKPSSGAPVHRAEPTTTHRPTPASWKSSSPTLMGRRSVRDAAIRPLTVLYELLLSRHSARAERRPSSERIQDPQTVPSVTIVLLLGLDHRAYFRAHTRDTVANAISSNIAPFSCLAGHTDTRHCPVALRGATRWDGHTTISGKHSILKQISNCDRIRPPVYHSDVHFFAIVWAAISGRC